MTTEAQAEQVQTLLEEGASLYEEGKLYEALASWAEALKIDPENEIAAEYLRFIEDNFGIGVDAFLSHGDEPAAPPPPPEVPPPPEAPPPPPVAAAPAPAAPARSPEESVEEMDWSEILEEGGDSAAPVAEAEPLMADEEFFVSLDADGPPPGAEAEAWGAAESPAEPPPTKPPSEPPANDPFTMPASQFSEVDPVVDPFGGPELGEEGVPDTWAVDELAGDAEPSEMGDDSIDLMLENDFKAWEEATGRRRVPPPTDPFAVEADPYDLDDPGSRPSRAPSLGGGDSQPPVVAPPLEDDWTGLPPPLSAPWPQQSQAEPAEPRSTRPLGSAPSRLSSQPAFHGRDVEEDSASIPIPELEEPESVRPGPAADIFGAVDSSPEALLPPVMASFFDDDEPGGSGEAFGSLEAEFGRVGLSDDSAGESPDFVPGLEPLDEAALDFPSLDLIDAAFPEPSAPPVQAAPPPPPPPPPAPARPAPAPPAPARPAEEEKLAGAVMRRRSRRKPSTPPAAAPAKQVVTAPVDPSVEALVRHSLSDLDEIESRAGSAVRQFMPDPLPADADLDAMMEQARRKQRAGDFSGSLEIVERVLAAEPHHGQAQAYLSENTNRLLDMFRSRIGPLARMPRVKLRPDEIIWQSLDHRAGFLVSQVDGRTTFEDLIEISGMSELEATRMLARLVEFGIIG